MANICIASFTVSKITNDVDTAGRTYNPTSLILPRFVYLIIMATKWNSRTDYNFNEFRERIGF